MKKIFCDICGKEANFELLLHRPNVTYERIEYDLCAECRKDIADFLFKKKHGCTYKEMFGTFPE